MDRYTYLLLGLLLLVPLAFMLLARKDLAGRAVRFGLLGGAAGLLSEFFYFRDYWRPPSLFGVAVVSAEDFVFGFAIAAMSFLVYLCVFNATFTDRMYANRSKLYGLFFLSGFLAMLFFNIILGINSIFVSSGIFLCLTLVMLLMRRDLLMVGMYSAGILTTFVVLVYALLFNVISPGFWNNYWLLASTKWGATVLGNIPLTEILWYFSWIIFASISYPFVSGKGVSAVQK